MSQDVRSRWLNNNRAGLEVHQFWPLVKIECSPDLRFFLCSMYTPICIDTYPKPLPACRSVCERAKLGCLPVMQKYGFEWPSRMSCSLLPEYGGKELCMDAQAQNPQGAGPLSRPSSRGLPGTSPPPPPGYLGQETECSCSACGSIPQAYPGNNLVQLRPGNPLFNQSISWAGQPDCSAPCYSPFFGTQDREFAELWLTVWSVVCCVSTSITIATFLLDPSRYNYPERSIMYLSSCYFLISVGFIIRIIVGHQTVSCSLQNPLSKRGYNNLLVSRAKIPNMYSDEDEVVCTLVFVLIYLFSMSSSLWWVILTLTWFLSAGLKWAEESISKYSIWFHAVVWGVPLIQTTVLLLISGVEGDNVAGICYVGSRNPSTMLFFIILPLTLYLIIGISFLSGGFISLFKIRRMLREDGIYETADKLEKFIIKIAIFGILYIAPVLTVIACSTYEAWNLSAWEKTYSCRGCLNKSDEYYPDFSVYMLKYFMQLAVGITSGFWIWSGKTIDAWSSLLSKLFILKRFNKTFFGKPSHLPPLPPLPRVIYGPPTQQAGGGENHYSTIPRRRVEEEIHV
ncbi:frizzled-8 [Eurytemora carolleeae]|uniref:frizzled-8 n=1 Tax=Eurytemora carolleeae TaxID=1294199 RepID=UPI000C785AAC|nr:frizzled-8 [Eurytemora carolleeae]|eukprot:XP_023341324.1 frizzled-8-like [Eurytemora affinis]